MKKLMMMASCALLLASCAKTVPQEQYDALKFSMDSIAEIKAQMEEVISTVNGAMNEIAADQNLIFVDDEGNDLKDKNAVLTRMQVIRDRMNKQREELEKAKRDLKNSRAGRSSLQKTIDELTALIAQKDAEIADLQKQLEESNISIADLKNRLNDMTIAKQEAEAERDQISEVAKQQDKELNTAYYVIDTKKNLKAAGLTEGVFKKKANYANLDASRFTKIDIRECTKIVIESKAPKMITAKPVETYSLTPNGDGTTTLLIKNPQAFWDGSPYLIIQK